MSNCTSILAMERPVSIAEELATERMIGSLNGWNFEAKQIIMNTCSDLHMAQHIYFNIHNCNGGSVPTRDR